MPSTEPNVVTGTRAMHIAFVGIDGAGKSRQAGLLHRRLGVENHDSYLFEGKDDFNIEMLRRVAVAEGRAVNDAWGIDIVMTAQTLDSLRDHYRMVVPLLNAGCNVVQARSVDARPVFARSAGFRRPDLLDALVALCPRPSLTFFLRVPSDQALRRIEQRGIDTEDPVALAAFARQLDECQPDADWLAIDGSDDATAIHERIWKAVSERLDARDHQLPGR